MSTREDIHRLVDEIDEQQLKAAAEALRGLTQRGGGQPKRRFSFAGQMSAESDLAQKSGDILRTELGSDSA